MNSSPDTLRHADRCADKADVADDEAKDRNVYVADLPVTFTELHLTEVMAQFGPVEKSRVFNNTRKVLQTGRAYGFCLFQHAADAARAIAALDGLEIDGRLIQVRLSDNGIVKDPPVKQTKPPKPLQPQHHTPRTFAHPHLSSTSPQSTRRDSDGTALLASGTVSRASPFFGGAVPMPAGYYVQHNTPMMLPSAQPFGTPFVALAPSPGGQTSPSMWVVPTPAPLMASTAPPPTPPSLLPPSTASFDQIAQWHLPPPPPPHQYAVPYTQPPTHTVRYP